MTLSITSYWNIKMALIAAHLNAEVLWWWQCSDRYIISLSPTSISPSPFSPSLISRTVFVERESTMFTYLLQGRTERCAFARKQHNIAWYNVVGTAVFRLLNCVSTFVSFYQWNFPTALLCLFSFASSSTECSPLRFIPHQKELLILHADTECWDWVLMYLMYFSVGFLLSCRCG